MPTLEERIENLEAELQGYHEDYKAATTSDFRKDKLLDIIENRGETLNKLLDQQRGKLIDSILVFSFTNLFLSPTAFSSTSLSHQ
jgi:hypothetical protein